MGTFRDDKLALAKKVEAKRASLAARRDELLARARSEEAAERALIARRAIDKKRSSRLSLAVALLPQSLQDRWMHGGGPEQTTLPPIPPLGLDGATHEQLQHTLADLERIEPELEERDRDARTRRRARMAKLRRARSVDDGEVAETLGVLVKGAALALVAFGLFEAGAAFLGLGWNVWFLATPVVLVVFLRKLRQGMNPYEELRTPRSLEHGAPAYEDPDAIPVLRDVSVLKARVHIGNDAPCEEGGSADAGETEATAESD